MNGLPRLVALFLLSLPATSPALAQQADAPLLTSQMPLTAAEEAEVRKQIESNWNLGDLMGSPELKDVVIELRVSLGPDGTVNAVEALDAQPDNPTIRQAVDSARRAVMISSPLKLPPGKNFPSMRLRFFPDKVIE